jgi:peroxiredoxin
MRYSPLRYLALAAVICGVAAGARADGRVGEGAPEFPPGVFTDGGRHQLSDFQGKVVVLFFYENDCPVCRGSFPQRAALAKRYQGKPVKFFGVAAGETPKAARQSASKLGMPVFVDAHNLMRRRYGGLSSSHDASEVRLVGADGKIGAVEMTPAAIDKALADVDLKYAPEEYHPKVRPAVELFEFNQHAAGMTLVRALRKDPDKAVATSAARLLEAVRVEGRQWMIDADGSAELQPATAFDLYTRVVTAFGASDELGKRAADAAAKLKSTDGMKRDLEARRAFDKVRDAMSESTSPSRQRAVDLAIDLTRKYPGTSSATQAHSLLKELGN